MDTLDDSRRFRGRMSDSLHLPYSLALSDCRDSEENEEDDCQDTEMG